MKVYVVVAHGDNNPTFSEDYNSFDRNIAVFTSKDLAEAFLKYPPALEEACIKHDIIPGSAEWTVNRNGEMSLHTCGSWDDYDVAFGIEEFELGEYEVKEEK